MYIHSIIAIWQGQNELPIVTTGDSIGTEILERINTLYPSNSVPPIPPHLGIFKVPHHGSQRNSQIDTSYDTTTTETQREKAHTFFLALVSWFLLQTPSLFSAVEARRVLAFKTFIIDQISPEWIDLDPTGSRDTNTFCQIMTSLATIFMQFLEYKKFTYQPIGSNTVWDLNPGDPAAAIPPNLDPSQHPFAGLKAFSLLLLDKYESTQQAVYANNPAAAKISRSLDYIKAIGFKSNEFLSPFPFPWLPRMPQGPGGNINWIKFDPQYVTLANELQHDPVDVPLYQQGIQAFYSRFR